ncbi:MAG: isoprenylcysteine carboxylmethyltransferase family protein [Flavobacteriales bacterium]|nr:isoprenylcysteine carboxylmethyltransferase family protein [Flavobacteriales bacterium]MBK9288220.1 isoprenylcysteine carboxylmethyltransferase family protein [Flavobacteriales bacterium]MBL0036802.1 isoprenylcysteine carboxylmethyltransferase family protein [Flavobacteriales bacterium]
MISRLLVLGQFGSIAVLLIGGGWQLPWWAWSLFILGLLVFGWAALSLGRNNFTILPDPREGNTLSQAGIYRLVRHPMYTAVLLCGVGVSFGAPSVWRWIALGVCLVLLLVKVRYEEGLLTARHPDYQERMKGVARLLPGVW